MTPSIISSRRRPDGSLPALKKHDEPMYRNDPCIVLTQDGANKIAGAETTGGLVIIRRAPSEAMYVVAAIEVKKGIRVSVDIPRQYVALNWGDPLHEAHWMRTPVPRLHVEHLILRRASQCDLELRRIPRDGSGRSRSR